MRVTLTDAKGGINIDYKSDILVMQPNREAPVQQSSCNLSLFEESY
jgi:hypothetical protein